MWSKVVDVLLEEIRKRRDPRRRLVSGLRELLDALETCHHRYSQYLSDTSDKAIYAHRDAVLELIRRLWRLRHVLPIFAPSVMEYLYAYTISEMEEWCPREAFQELWLQFSKEHHSHEDLSESFRTIEDLLMSDKPVLPDIVRSHSAALDLLRLGKLTAWAWGAKKCTVVSVPIDYDTAVSKLSEFIRQEFKPEEFV